MPVQAYQYVLELSDADGAALGREPFAPDTVPAGEYARFEGIRLEKLPAVTAAAPVSFEPVWDDRAGRPYVAGLRASVRGNDGQTLSVEVPRTYFNGDARRASAGYVAAGRLRKGEVFYYKVTAFAATSGGASGGDGNRFEEISQPLEISDTPIAQFQANAVAVGEAVDGDTPIFLNREALAQAEELCISAHDVETGGILLGRLHRDTADRRVVFIEITAQVPAAHTVQQFTRVTFTADTWAAARAAMRLRGRGEQMAGWHHFHPDFCEISRCEKSKRRDCALAGIFFSSEDCGLHRTVFPLAHQVGLLISDRGGMVPAVFGWRRGLIVPRSFHVTADVSAAASAARPEVFEGRSLTVSVGGNEHAQD